MMMIALILGYALSLGSQKTADPTTYVAVVSTLQPGDTLTLAAGTYVGNLNLNNLNGTPSDWISIQGPASGPPAVFLADAFNNTVEIGNCSYLALKRLTMEGQHLDGPFGISAHNGSANITHDILIEGCTIQNYDGSQQTDGISTKTPTWRWTIRGNRLINVGTGIYFGNSNGDDPFVAGLIEGNLFQDTIGYCMQIKYQNPRPAVAGMPTGTSSTIIRNNVFIKSNAPSPDGDRPNLLVGGFPNSGAGMNDLYEIYGNLFYHNPRESLFQGSGRVSLHDNIFVDVVGTAILLQNHDLALKLAHVYNNTIYAAGDGIYFGSTPVQGGAVVGNLVFATAPIGGAVPLQQDNIVGPTANASTYVKNPSTTLGAMDYFPLVGKCQGTALNLTPFAGQTDYDRDFNGTSKGSFAFRGAYAGEGTNPGWALNAGLKGGGSSGTPPPSPPTPPPTTGGGSGSTGGAGGGGGGCGATGLEGLVMLALREAIRRRRLLALLSLSLMACTLSGTLSAGMPASTWTQKGGSVAMDVQGYAYNPSITAGPNGELYAVWSQHRKADVWEMVSPYAALYSNGSWQALGGRIGNTPGPGFAQGFDPSIVVLGTTPYVAWYEGGGYGWGTIGGQYCGSSIFVSHWNGIAWVRDSNAAMPNGALNVTFSGAGWNLQGRNPRLAVINSKVYCAWVESRPGDYAVTGYNVIVVKHLDAGQWIQDGPEFNVGTSTGARITDLAIVDIGGDPHVAWSEHARAPVAGGTKNSPGTVQVAKLSGGAWTTLGGTLNASATGYSSLLSMAVSGGTPYVAWLERSAGGRNQLYVKHWTGSAWAADGASLNVDPAGGEACRPTLASSGGTVWLAWAEGSLNQPSQLYVRSLSGGVWSASEGSLNLDTTKGAADTPSLVVAGGVPQVVWGEYDPSSSTQQIYVKGRDAAGVPAVTPLSPFGASGPAVTIPNNTWVNMNPGGIGKSAWGIGDEAYDSFHYAPGIKKAICYGLYHSNAVSWGEDQNALLAYDFAANRWDLLAPGEFAASEHLPGVGHDEGNSTVDTVHHLYITHGNLTVGHESWYQTHVFDLKGHRGKRMMPPNEPSGPRTDVMASAFDPDHDLVLMMGPSSSWLYDHNTNLWTALANSPQGTTLCLVYDTKNHLFVMFNGFSGGHETWTLDPVSKIWTQKAPAASPSTYVYPYAPSAAYDSTNGVTLLLGGNKQEVWIYDAAASTWTRVADTPAGVPINQVDGAYLVYDSDHQVFLVRHSADLNQLWAYRYVPAGTPSDTTAPSVPGGLNATAISTSQIDLSWSASTDNVGVAGYRVYQGGTQIGTTSATFFSSTGLSASTAYTYTVAAYDAAGNVSGQSSPATASTLAPSGDTQPPTVPMALVASAVSSSQIDLSWTASTDNVGVTAYQVSRGGVLIGTVTSGTSYSDTGLSASTAYSYTVVALDAAGNASAASTAASATTLAAPPAGGGSSGGGTGGSGSSSGGNKAWGGCGLLGPELLLILALSRARRRRPSP
jgi:chitodextrinase